MKCLSLCLHLLKIITITFYCLLATSRIITQYTNKCLWYNFTTSPLKINESSISTFILSHIHVGLGTIGFLSMRFKWFSAWTRRIKALQGGKTRRSIPSKALSTWPFLWKRIISELVYVGIGWLSLHATNPLSTGPRREKTCLRGFANNTGADQPAHPRRLISAYVIRFLQSIIYGLATGQI